MKKILLVIFITLGFIGNTSAGQKECDAGFYKKGKFCLKLWPNAIS